MLLFFFVKYVRRHLRVYTEIFSNCILTYVYISIKRATFSNFTSLKTVQFVVVPRKKNDASVVVVGQVVAHGDRCMCSS